MKEFFPAPRSLGDYQATWIIGAITGVVCALWFLAFSKSHSAVALQIPIAVGLLAILIYEFLSVGIFSRRKADHLVTLPEDYQGLSAYRELLTLDLRPSRSSKGQLVLFPGFEEPTSHNSVRFLKDLSGKDIPSVSCERFSALLVTYLMNNLDKATEKALMAALARFDKMGGEARPAKLFLEQKTLRELIKSDIRGNVLAQISKGGEKVIIDLIKTIEEAKQKESKGEPTAQNFSLHG